MHLIISFSSIFIEITLVYKLSTGKSALYDAETSYSRIGHVFQYDHIHFYVLWEYGGKGRLEGGQVGEVRLMQIVSGN